MVKTKKQSTNKQSFQSPTENNKITPLAADRTWNVIKEISAGRANQLADNKIEAERLYRLADESKKEFMINLIRNYQADGQEIFAEDVLTILTTMTLTLANELFEHNEEIMQIINTPETCILETGPHQTKNGPPLYT